MRIDFYGIVHKAQRYQLFTFAQWLAHADLDDAPTCTRLGNAVRELGEMLRDHAENERRYIHPLFDAVGHGAERLELDHLELESDIAAWIGLVDEQRWDELYRASMRVIGKYLLHIDAEERAQTEILWSDYSDMQLAEVMGRFRAERSPRAARADLELFITALGIADLASFLDGLSSGPSAVKQEVFNFARQLLDAERWAAVAARLR